jgi:hypothetical protein
LWRLEGETLAMKLRLLITTSANTSYPFEPRGSSCRIGRNPDSDLPLDGAGIEGVSPVFEEGSVDYLGPDGFSRVNARTYQGTLNRLLTFQQTRGTFADQLWPEHDMASWGGASGSPIFNRSGKVVALHNAGLLVRGQKHAANPNKGAIRVDLLRDLMLRSR